MIAYFSVDAAPSERGTKRKEILSRDASHAFMLIRCLVRSRCYWFLFLAFAIFRGLIEFRKNFEFRKDKKFKRP